MAEDRKTVVVQISRGVAPAVAIAATVSAATRRNLDYQLLTGMTAAAAKERAAAIAYTSGRDLILCEDDFIADAELWDRMATDKSNVLATSALMRNGQINVLYHRDRLVLSGTVMLSVPWEVLDEMGNPWFKAQNLHFEPKGEGSWVDHGENPHGFHSDTWFFYRCWDCGIRPEVAGFVTHLMHPYNSQLHELNKPQDIKPLGMMECAKLVG